MKIVIISSSIRNGRQSHHVTLYFEKFIKENYQLNVEIIDLEKLNFPLFHERLKFLENPTEKEIEFGQKIEQADGVLIVTPEYNGGYPASLKNVIDLLGAEWVMKPVAFATVSGGMQGGAQVLQQLQFVLWKMGAITVPQKFMVAQVNNNYSEDGTVVDNERTDKTAKGLIDKLIWFIEAKAKME